MFRTLLPSWRLFVFAASPGPGNRETIIDGRCLEAVLDLCKQIPKLHLNLREYDLWCYGWINGWKAWGRFLRRWTHRYTVWGKSARSTSTRTCYNLIIPPYSPVGESERPRKALRKTYRIAGIGLRRKAESVATLVGCQSGNVPLQAIEHLFKKNVAR